MDLAPDLSQIFPRLHRQEVQGPESWRFDDDIFPRTGSHWQSAENLKLRTWNMLFINPPGMNDTVKRKLPYWGQWHATYYPLNLPQLSSVRRSALPLASGKVAPRCSSAASAYHEKWWSPPKKQDYIQRFVNFRSGYLLDHWKRQIDVRLLERCECDHTNIHLRLWHKCSPRYCEPFGRCLQYINRELKFSDTYAAHLPSSGTLHWAWIYRKPQGVLPCGPQPPSVILKG